jgi:hypothetical protein
MQDVELTTPTTPRIQFREDARQIFFKVQYLFQS